MKLKWLAGAALAAALATAAVAQTIATFNLNGSEGVLGQLGPGGGSIYIPSYVLRNGSNHTLVATATNVTTTSPATSKEILATGAITNWTVLLPSSPYTGQKITINCPGGAITNLIVSPVSPAVLVGTAPSSCSGGGAMASGSSWTYSTTAVTWYRYQ